MEVGLGFWPAKVLLSAIELGVFTELGGNSKTGRELQVIPARMPWAPRFSPVGRRIAYGAIAPGQENTDSISTAPPRK